MLPNNDSTSRSKAEISRQLFVPQTLNPHTPSPSHAVNISPRTPKPLLYIMSNSPGGKRKPSASPQTQARERTVNMAADGFTKVETKEERRKRKKVEKRRPQFQFDMSAFKSGKKVGMAVSAVLRHKQVHCDGIGTDSASMSVT